MADKFYQVEKNLLTKDKVTCQFCRLNNHIGSSCYKIIGKPNKNNNNNNNHKSRIQPQQRSTVQCGQCNRMGHLSSQCREEGNKITCSYCSRFGHHINDCRKKIIDEELQQKNGNLLLSGNERRGNQCKFFKSLRRYWRSF